MIALLYLLLRIPFLIAGGIVDDVLVMVGIKRRGATGRRAWWRWP